MSLHYHQYKMKMTEEAKITHKVGAGSKGEEAGAKGEGAVTQWEGVWTPPPFIPPYVGRFQDPLSREPDL